MNLLPIVAADAGSIQNVQINRYSSTFSSRLERKWHRPVRKLFDELGNGYLYRWASRVLDELFHDSPAVLLDAACGDGVLKDYLSTHHTYFGIDFSPRLLARAARYRHSSYFRADLTQIPFPNETFDVVFCIQVLQYLEQPRLALAEISRVLKRNGKLILSVPNSGCLKYRVQRPSRIQRQQFDQESISSVLLSSFRAVSLNTRGIWIPFPKLSIHLPVAFADATGLSWTIVAEQNATLNLS